MDQSTNCSANHFTAQPPIAAGWRRDPKALVLPLLPAPRLPPAAPTSEDVDRELSRPRLFFPGGLLLVLKESLLPAEGGDQGRRSRAGVGAGSSHCPAEAPTPGLGGNPLTLGRQAIGPRDWAVGSRQGGRQGGEGHRKLHIENLQPLLLGRQAQDLFLKPLVFLLQRVQCLQHLHDCRERVRAPEPCRPGEAGRGRGAGRESRRRGLEGGAWRRNSDSDPKEKAPAGNSKRLR